MPKKKQTPEQDMRIQVIEDMKNLGIYKPQYDRLIDIFVDLMIQYQKFNTEFKASGYQYETETAAGGTKKSAIAATLETLRKDIIAYSDRLCLNPKAIESVTIDKKGKSKLASLLNTLEK